MRGPPCFASVIADTRFVFVRYRTYPNEPNVDYPEGFQGTQIPVYPPTVVQVIEERLAGLHPFDGPPDHYDH